jgi:hypothetical protein
VWIADRRQTIHRRGSRLTGANAGQHFVQHGTECVHIGRCRYRLTAQLLGGRVSRSQCAELGFDRAGGRMTQYAGNSEIEQFDVAVAADQHIGGFDVAVDDELSMGELDGRADLEEQAQTQREVRIA